MEFEHPHLKILMRQAEAWDGSYQRKSAKWGNEAIDDGKRGKVCAWFQGASVNSPSSIMDTHRRMSSYHTSSIQRMSEWEFACMSAHPVLASNVDPSCPWGAEAAVYSAGMGRELTYPGWKDVRGTGDDDRSMDLRDSSKIRSVTFDFGQAAHSWILSEICSTLMNSQCSFYRPRMLKSWMGTDGSCW
jgi:hypothetical protein